MPSCVIIVENLPVPLDRRVWQEARALTAAGWQVSVICPLTEQYPDTRETLEGIDIYRHPLPLEAHGKFAFLLEYGAALFHQARLLFTIWRKTGFDVIQACNPPDLIFLVAAPYKLIGKHFIYDQHDVCPELFEAKFDRKGLFHRLLVKAERLTYRSADIVIAANETFRNLAIDRGGKHPNDVVSVYSIPENKALKPATSRSDEGTTVLGYVGIIGQQDGVDHLVQAVHHLMRDHGLTDIRAVVVGDGPALADSRRLADTLGIAGNIEFTGYLRGEDLLSAMGTFDIGIIPDPVNPFNDKVSMNKVFEYSSLGIPSVSYRLTETMRLLGPAGVFADDPTPAGLAEACLPLIADRDLRRAKGEEAFALAERSFDWDMEAKKFVGAYARLAPAGVAMNHA